MAGDHDRGGDERAGSIGEMLRAMAAPDSSAARLPDDIPGTTIGHYQVLDKLGQGGMGVVFRARDTRLGRDVALKVLPAAVAGDGERRARLLREARSAAAVNHPNIATVYDVGESDGRVWLAMELVEGTTLRGRLASGALRADEALRIARAIATGLAKAHEKGIVHRDLKPENVLLASDGGVKILDFGLAKLREPVSSDSALGQRQTETLEGRVMGTPGYMSPEQAAGRPVDQRTDVYALGVVLHEMLTGGLPGLGSGRKPITDARIEAIVARCLDPWADQRWPDAGAVGAEIDAATRHRPPPASAHRVRNSVLLAISALALAVTVAVGALPRLRGAYSSSAAPSAPASAAPALAVTTYTDQPLPPTNVPAARVEYAAGLQSLRDDRSFEAHRHFAKVVDLDPSIALGHLRTALTRSSPEPVKAELDAAFALRSQLGERDLAVLDALEPTTGRHPDLVLAETRLEAATQRWPLDVELLDLIEVLGAPAPEREIELAERATTLDPRDVQAWEVLGRGLASLGRMEEARRAFEHGVSLTRAPSDVMSWLATLDSVEGRCEEMERLGERISDYQPIVGVFHLEDAKRALGRPRAELEELHRRLRGLRPADELPLDDAKDEAIDALIAGRFDVANEKLDAWERLISTDLADYYEHLVEGRERIYAAQETGDVTAARTRAREFLERRRLWGWEGVRYNPRLGGADLSLWMTRIAEPSGIREQDRAAWVDERLASHALPFAVWAYAWAAPATNVQEALAALDSREHDPRFQPPLDAPFYGGTGEGLPEAYAGRVYLLAGRAPEAVPWLRRAVAQCTWATLYVDQMHARLDLGEALEQTGDTKGACDAYADVLSRWGHAVPRSVTADAARDGAKRLHCPP